MPAPTSTEASASPAHPIAPRRPSGSALEVFWAFFQLGWTCFGGPIAHLGYFQTTFVERKRWLSSHAYADLVALCQFLPGPTSSQVGMALGLQRAGWWGAFAAWLGFTLPSALLLIGFAYGVQHAAGAGIEGILHGLKVVAVAVVAHAVWGMAQKLCADRVRRAIMLAAALFVLVMPSAIGQIIALLLAGLLGWRWISSPAAHQEAYARYNISKKAAVIAGTAFVGLLLVLPILAYTSGSAFWLLMDGFYRTGALVFGGGHVMLPLLQTTVVDSGALDHQRFIAGYGAAQAIPGPLTAFAAYLGTLMSSPLQGWLGGLVFLIVIFLPAFLILVAALAYWEVLIEKSSIRSIVAGINAGVVGVLLAALYDPVWTSAIHTRLDFALLLATFGLLTIARLNPLWVVLFGATGGWLLSLI